MVANITFTESTVNIHIGKACTVINELSTIWILGKKLRVILKTAVYLDVEKPRIEGEARMEGLGHGEMKQK